MERLSALFYLVCIGICFVGIIARQNEDREFLIREILDSLGIQSDTRTTQIQNGQKKDISRVDNGNKYNRKSIKKGFFQERNNDELTGSEIDEEIRALEKEIEEERMKKLVESFLTAERERQWMKKGVTQRWNLEDDPIARASNATTTGATTPPETPPRQTTIPQPTAPSATQAPVRIWGNRRSGWLYSTRRGWIFGK